MTRIDETTLAELEAELARDGVWVSPGLRQEVTAAEEAQIEAAVAAQPGPTYVVLAELDYDDPLTSGRFEQLAGVVRDDTGLTGTYLGLEASYGSEGYRLGAHAFPDEYDLYQAVAVAAAEEPDDLAAQTLRAVDLLRTDEAETLYEQQRESGGAGGSGGPGPGGDAGSGALLPVTGALLVAVLLVVGWVRRSRRRGTTPAPHARGGAFTLPEAVVRSVREAEDRRQESLAQEAVLSLGEAIDAADLEPVRPRGLGAWQAALDHYDVARRILDRRHSPADVVGALVLARRGSEALAAGRRNRSWTPTPGCYLNPLHDPATDGRGRVRRARWGSGGASVEVPVCSPCGDALARGDRPSDVLDFVVDGKPVHYLELDLGPWSSTGYGSLEPDLLGALLRR
ncbi:MAG: hypothetical protein CMH83_17030 [Nocardioides sp.]|nr:hypothetical protein [Nocardioides sp.]